MRSAYNGILTARRRRRACTPEGRLRIVCHWDTAAAFAKKQPYEYHRNATPPGMTLGIFSTQEETRLPLGEPCGSVAVRKLPRRRAIASS